MDVEQEIARKVAHSMSEIDMIIAQFSEGSSIETHTESLNRRIREWESKWSELQEQFKQVKPGPNLAEEYQKMKRQVVGAQSKYIVHFY